MPKPDVSPIVVEIIRNALNSIAQEMNNSLLRSAYTPLIYEMKDCSVGLFDKDANLLGQSSGLPIFMGNLEICVKLVTEKIGAGAYREGDIFLMNDSYMQGTHLGDFSMFSPVFYQGALVGFTANRAHMLDIGSSNVVFVNEIFQEGLRLTPIKICDNGVMRDDIMDMICANSRMPETLRGDIGAMIASCRTGEKRFRELLDRFGLAQIEAARDIIYAQTERADREAVRRIPDGSYYGEGYLDDNPADGREIKICARVDVQGDDIHIDLSGSSPAVFGPTNCGLAQTVAAGRVAFKELIHPDRPVNGGNFRNLTVSAEKGSIFYAEPPTSCRWYFTALGLLIDLIVRIMAPFFPEQAAGAHYGDSMVFYYIGTNPADGKYFKMIEATAGGWGGYEGGDGESCLINLVNGDFKNMPVELVERKYPVEVLRYAVRTDSEGAGKFRGGMGVERVFSPTCDGNVVSAWFDRSKTPAWGLLGGQSAAPPYLLIQSRAGGEQRFVKCDGVPVQCGDVISVYTGGGGGYGDPLERSRDSVREDVENGYITGERAAAVYGLDG